MGKITIRIPDEIETDFRNAVFNAMGMKKGNINLAMTEAVVAWTRKNGVKK